MKRLILIGSLGALLGFTFGFAARAVAATTRYAFRSNVLLGHTVHRDYLHSALSLSGQLVDSYGVPAPGVLVTAYSGALTAAGFTPIAGAVTDANGHYAISVPNGPPRLLQLSAAGTTVTIVRELVSPSVWMRVISRPHRTLVFHGRIWTDGPGPAIVVKDRTPSNWATFAVTYPNAGGRFRVVYHGPASTAGLRVKVRATTFPLAGWKSGASAVQWAAIRR